MDINIQKPKFAPYQEDFLYCTERFSVTEASTKTGKTFSHIFWLFEYAHGKNPINPLEIREGMEFWWVAPVYSQAKIAFNRMWRKVAATGVYSKKESPSELQIKTPIGSVIMFKTAKNADTLYGEDVHAAVFDEFTRSKPEAWYALRTTLTATKAPCKFIGNYKGKSNWGHQLGLKSNQKDSEYKRFKVTAWDAVKAGILDEEEILQAQQDLPAFMFKALYLAEGDIDQARLIEEDAIQDLRTNSHVKQDGKMYMTCDIAMHGSDRFIICVWNGLVLKYIESVEKCDAKEIEEKIRGLAQKFSVMHSNIAYDADGLGTYLRGYLKNAKPFVNNSTALPEERTKVKFENLKSQCYYNFSQRVNDGGYYLECDIDEYWTETVEELEVVKNRNFGQEVNSFAVLRKHEIKEVIGRSPDISDALMMREIFELKPSKRRRMLN